MSLLLDSISYQTADGLLNSNLSDQNNLFYVARKLFLSQVYDRAWNGVAPSSTWLEAKRKFFITGGTGFNYVISGITYTLAPTTIYCCAPSEFPRIVEQAAALGLSVADSTYGAWQGIGSVQTFYW